MQRAGRQLALSLPPRSRWGGRRANAGRKPSPRPSDPHRRRDPLSSRHPCHFTLKVRREVPSLRSVRFVREFEAALRAIHSCRSRFRLVHYSIQSDHVHLIVEAASTRDVSCGMKSVGARLARSVHRVFAWTSAVLADRFHLHVLRTPREVRNAIAYVLLNARRHLAKLGRRLCGGRLPRSLRRSRWIPRRQRSAPREPGCSRSAGGVTG